MTIVTSGSGLADIAGIVESTGKVSFTSGQGDVRLFGASGLTTPRSVSVAIEDGAFVDTTLRPGRGSVEFVFSTRRYGPYPIVVPESGTHTVASLITSAVLIPPDTAPELIIKAVEAYLESNPVGGGGLSVEQIAAAADDPASPLGQTLAQSYAPASLADDLAAKADADAVSEALSSKADSTALTPKLNAAGGAKVLLGWRVVTDVEFGAAGSGNVDDTSAIQAAINSLPNGGVVYLPAGTFNVTGLTIGSGVELVGAGSGSTRIRQTGWSTPLFTAAGAIGSSIALTANVVRGDYTLTLASTAGLAAGDTLLLGSNEAFSVAQPSEYRGELATIQSVDSATQITIMGGAKDSYSASSTGMVRKLTMHRNGGIRDLRISNTEPAQHNAAMVSVKYAQRFVARNVRLDGCDGAGFVFDCAQDCRVETCDMSDFTDDAANSRFGYGVCASRATEGLIVSGCTGRRLRHMFTTVGVAGAQGAPRNILVVGCSASECSSAAFDTHDQGDGIAFVGCTVYNNRLTAFQIRSRNTRVVSCQASRVPYAVWMFGTANGSEIRGCTFRDIKKALGNANSGIGVVIGDGIKNVVLSDNTIDGVDRQNIVVTGNSDNLSVLNNNILNAGRAPADAAGAFGLVFASTVAATGVSVIGNVFGSKSAALYEEAMVGTMIYAISLPVGVTGAFIANNSGFGITNGMINDSAPAGANRKLNNVRLNVTEPLISPGGLTTKVQGGPVSDADFALPPENGTLAVDQLNNHLYVKSGGVWRPLPLPNALQTQWDVNPNLGTDSAMRFSGARAAIGYIGGKPTLSDNGTGKNVVLSSGGAAKVEASPTGIGFLGTAPVTKPSITGSRTGESAASASTRAALVSLGLATDNTTA